MKEKLEVGQVWIANLDKEECIIKCVGNDIVIFEDGEREVIDLLHLEYTLKKPEPKLIKLVAWVGKYDQSDVVISTSDAVDMNEDHRIAKPIIIKDGELFVSED
jgi:hypothetical protein